MASSVLIIGPSDWQSYLESIPNCSSDFSFLPDDRLTDLPESAYRAVTLCWPVRDLDGWGRLEPSLRSLVYGPEPPRILGIQCSASDVRQSPPRPTFIKDWYWHVLPHSGDAAAPASNEALRQLLISSLRLGCPAPGTSQSEETSPALQRSRFTSFVAELIDSWKDLGSGEDQLTAWRNRQLQVLKSVIVEDGFFPGSVSDVADVRLWCSTAFVTACSVHERNDLSVFADDARAFVFARHVTIALRPATALGLFLVVFAAFMRLLSGEKPRALPLCVFEESGTLITCNLELAPIKSDDLLRAMDACLEGRSFDFARFLKEENLWDAAHQSKTNPLTQLRLQFRKVSKYPS